MGEAGDICCLDGGFSFGYRKGKDTKLFESMVKVVRWEVELIREHDDADGGSGGFESSGGGQEW
jgi:hypothetical protein